MTMFERITRQMLVECQDGETEWQQAWWNKIPDGATEPVRDEDEEDNYRLAWTIINKYVAQVGLDVNCFSETDRAVYDFEKDKINCPCRLQFDTDADFFCTLFHELIHSTGASNRLVRPGFSMEDHAKEYNQEELIAELGSMYLCGICCYNDGKVFQQSSSYIRHYKTATKSSDDDLRVIAKKAMQAVRYILGNFD